MHLILPLAASQRWPQHLPSARELPHLGRLLARMQLQRSLQDAAFERPHPLLPHERVRAQALGWPEAGPWPQAAQDTARPGPQAWLTPCHWQVGMDRVVMLPPHLLQLQDEESQQLLQAMQPWLAEDGLQVQWHSALRWHASGPLLDGVCTASLARVSGADVHPWITDGSLPPALRRLQSEMQMLLYHHPVNDARLARGQLSVNSFWLHGAGAAPAPAPGTTPAAHTAPQQIDTLQHAAEAGPDAWRQAWQRVDADVLAPLALGDGPAPLQLSLCSETAAQTWTLAPSGWSARLARLLRPPRPDTVLSALLSPTDKT